MHADPFNPFIRPMLLWQKVSILAFIGGFFYPLLMPPQWPSWSIWIVWTCVIVTVLILVGFLFCAANHECGIGYAFRHVLLILLLGIFGIIIAPYLVRSDLEKRRWAMGIVAPPTCGNCGYDLRGTMHAVCPECGETVRRTRGSNTVANASR